MSITPQEAADPLAKVTMEQSRLLRIALISLVIAEVISAPIMLLLLPGATGLTVVLVQVIATCAALVALYQLRIAGLQSAMLVATIGFVAALALLYIAFGLRVSLPFLPVALIPVTWTAILGSQRITWTTIGSCILLIGVAALEVLHLPWIGFVQTAEFPIFVDLFIMPAILLLVGWFLIQSGQALRTAVAQGQLRQRDLEQLRDALETTVVARTESLQQALDEVQRREVQLSQTLADLHASQATIRELSAPIIPVLSGVLVLPLVGALDSTRAAMLSDQVLRAVEQRRARKVIFDVTGLPVLDSQVAHVLLRTAASVQLIGAAVGIAGVRPEVAQTMVALQIDFGAITTYADLQEAITKTLRDAGWQQRDQSISHMQRVLQA